MVGRMFFPDAVNHHLTSFLTNIMSAVNICGFDRVAVDYQVGWNAVAAIWH